MPESLNAAVDVIAMVAVWLSALVILVLSARWLNNIDSDRRGIWSHVERNSLVGLAVGAFCIALAPLYGWVWAFYGACILTVTVAAYLGARWWFIERAAERVAREQIGQFNQAEVEAAWTQVKRSRALIVAALAYGESLRQDAQQTTADRSQHGHAAARGQP